METDDEATVDSTSKSKDDDSVPADEGKDNGEEDNDEDAEEYEDADYFESEAFYKSMKEQARTEKAKEFLKEMREESTPESDLAFIDQQMANLADFVKAHEQELDKLLGQDNASDKKKKRGYDETETDAEELEDSATAEPLWKRK